MLTLPTPSSSVLFHTVRFEESKSNRHVSPQMVRAYVKSLSVSPQNIYGATHSVTRGVTGLSELSELISKVVTPTVSFDILPGGFLLSIGSSIFHCVNHHFPLKQQLNSALRFQSTMSSSALKHSAE